MATMFYSTRAEVSPLLNAIWVFTQAAVIIGAINWGMVGLNDYNLVEHLFGTATAPTRIIYSIIGFSGFVQFIRLVRFFVEAGPVSTNSAQ